MSLRFWRLTIIFGRQKITYCLCCPHNYRQVQFNVAITEIFYGNIFSLPNSYFVAEKPCHCPYRPLNASLCRHVESPLTSLQYLLANLYTSVVYFIKGANPQRVSTEIIIEIKQLNSGRMASQAHIESIWCTH